MELNKSEGQMYIHYTYRGKQKYTVLIIDDRNVILKSDQKLSESMLLNSLNTGCFIWVYLYFWD